MIISGWYQEYGGIYRPYVTAYVRSPAGAWKKYDFLVDTGADVTFLHYGAIADLSISTERIADLHC
ncbi:MAG: hypothetical protein HY731_13240 [Candidatus Tectomicrobia bacterium]|nr:hypothetical protein [Candidatus Tectomicrobia bacterium]